jgi:hypothetical protein
VLQWANKYKRLKVFANAETNSDVEKAHELGFLVFCFYYLFLLLLLILVYY